jgi:hypothetical protein
VLNVILKKYPENFIIFSVCFLLTRGKMANTIAHQRTILKVKKPLEVLS